MVIRKDIMLKIFFIFIAILFCTANYTFAATPTGGQKSDNVSIMYKKPSHDQMRKQFEQRLNLTDKQKEKARQIHKQGHAEMRPVMMKIQMKRQEIETIRLTKLSEREMTERIDKLNNEISNLEKQARDIRKKNTQDFEKILNKSQRAELEKMKAEGRARFEKNHQARPLFQGLGTPNFLFKPLLPPPDMNMGK